MAHSPLFNDVYPFFEWHVADLEEVKNTVLKYSIGLFIQAGDVMFQFKRYDEFCSALNLCPEPFATKSAEVDET